MRKNNFLFSFFYLQSLFYFIFAKKERENKDKQAREDAVRNPKFLPCVTVFGAAGTRQNRLDEIASPERRRKKETEPK
jgi:hypothetical protein